MTIACVGITVLDRIFRVTNLPISSGKFVANDYFEIGGGPAATAAVAVSVLGHQVEFIGRVGEDDVATTMLQEFDHYSVNYSHIIKVPGASSTFSAVVVDDEGERMIINHQDKLLSKDCSPLQFIDFSAFSTILCDVRWTEGAKYALKMAKEHGIPSILDADITPEPIAELVALADHIVFSEVGLVNFSGSQEPEQGLRIAATKTAGNVYVTVGSKGCYWLENDELKHHQGIKVNVVDTTGAGDVFHGAFAVAIAEKMNLREAVIFSNKVAALKCTKIGGREGIPSREILEKQ